jgi:hypothetical protein
MDAVPGLFARFMAPAARPILHYVLNRPGTPERTLTVRAAAFAWPIAGPEVVNVQLQFEAADPAAYDPTARLATSWSGSVGSGRVYPLTFPRSYPTGGAQANATITSPGDLPVRPLLRIYGPITRAQVQFAASGQPSMNLNTIAGYQIAAGHYLAVDCAARTVTLDGDPTQPAMASIDWSSSQWPALGPGITWTMILAGDPTGLVTTGLTQVQASWHDAYLT